MTTLKGFLNGIEWKEVDGPIAGGGQIVVYPIAGKHSKAEVDEVVKSLKPLNRPILVDYGIGLMALGGIDLTADSGGI